MTTKSTTLLVAALLGLGVTANAAAVTVTAYTTYTDRALFEAALTSSMIEDFDSYPIIGVPEPSPISDDFGLTSFTSTDPDDFFSLQAKPGAIKTWHELYFGSHNTTAGMIDGKFLFLDTDDGPVGSTTDFLLNSPVTAFGFDYTGVYGHDATFKVTIGSKTFDNLVLNDDLAPSSHLFWGVIGTTSFDTVTLITDFDGGYGVDEVTFGFAIPLPPAIWLFGSGLLALAGSGMKRKIHS